MRKVYAGLAIAGIGISSVVVASAAPAGASTKAASASPCKIIQLDLDLTSSGGPYIPLLCL
jgi:hypothetical protein